MSRKFFLIGMPGAGKTTYGRRWATLHDLPFYDTDELLREQTGKTIPEIFSQGGQEAFRVAEKMALDFVLSLPNDAIISCGGGTLMFYDNLERMLAAGCVIYLEAETEFLLERILAKPEERPLLTKGNPELLLEILLEERESTFRKADIIVQAASLTDATFAEILKQCTNRP